MGFVKTFVLCGQAEVAPSTMPHHGVPMEASFAASPVQASYVLQICLGGCLRVEQEEADGVSDEVHAKT